MTFNVGEKYHTRNNKLVELNGVSEYTIFGENTRIVTGIIDGEWHSWNKEGKYLSGMIFLNEKTNDLDLLYSSHNISDPGIYYVEFKKETR